MAKITIAFGAALVLLGIAGFVATGRTHYTALIPTWIGLLLAGLGFVADTGDSKRRALFMHIAVTLGLLGAIFTFKGGIVDYVLMQQGHYYLYPAAIEAKAVMCLLMLVFVALCVRSFIAARRARV